MLPVPRPGEVLADEQVVLANPAMDVEHPTLGAGEVRAATDVRGAPVDRPRRRRASASTTRRCGRSPTPPREDRPTPRRQPLRSTPCRKSGCSTSVRSSPPRYGSKILSDLGADVIVIETPGGDQMRPLPNPFEAGQRGKRNLVIDLKTPEGRALAHELVRTADVVVHNQRPGKAEKLTIDYKSLAAINPQLIYCYLPGYGSSGPKAHLKAFAPLISGFTGLLFEGAGTGNPPVRSVEGNEDYYNGLLGATAVLMGLEHRAKTGAGQYIESPQLHSSLFVTSHHFLGAKGESIDTLQLDHEQMGWGPLYRLYPTADGYLCIAAVGDRAFQRLAAAVKLSDGLVKKCADAAGRREHAAALAAELAERFGRMTSAVAFEALRSHRVPCEIPASEPVLPRLFFEKWFEQSGRMFEHAESPFGPIREIGMYVQLSETPGQRKGPAPRLGQHSVEIMRELGYGEKRIEELVERRVVFRDAVAE